LSGLDNFSDSSIYRIDVQDNDMLSDCATPSICHYLSEPGSNVEIYDNEAGCNNAVEILDACETLSTDEPAVSSQRSAVSGQWSAVRVFPNPANDQLGIVLPLRIYQQNGKIEIMNVNGTALISKPLTGLVTMLDIRALTQGVYFMKVTDDSTVMVRKFVKQ
jgi:hypothetical protein